MDGSEDTQHHPLFEFLDVLLMEYALATGATIPDRPCTNHTTLWLHYRTISVVRRLVFRDTNSMFGGQVEMPPWAKQRIQQLPWVDESGRCHQRRISVRGLGMDAWWMGLTPSNESVG